jgi:hypothetical protein
MIGLLTALLNKKESGQNYFPGIGLVRFRFASTEKASKWRKNRGVFP